MSKVLIIDDNRDLADGVAAVFSYEGIHADVAYNGQSGMDAMQGNNYDIVFLDAKLPDSNGIKLYKEIHASKPDVEIVLVTGYRIEQLLAEYVTDGKVEAINCSNSDGLKSFINESSRNDISVVRCSCESDAKNFANNLEVIAQSTGKSVISVNIDSYTGPVSLEAGDILILDTNVSLLNVFEFYIEEKNNGHQCVTFILQRGGANVADVLESYNTTKCIFKPFNPEDLVKIVTGLENAAA